MKNILIFNLCGVFLIVVSVVAFGVSLANAQILLSCVCNADLSPVCGSDGRTYHNQCVLACDAKDNPQLTMKHRGACRSRRPNKKGRVNVMRTTTEGAPFY